MKIDLAAMARRAGKTRQRQIVVGAIVPTTAQRTDLQTIYMRVVREWGRQIPARVMPVYERTLSGMMADSHDDVQREMDTVSAALSRLVLTLNANLEDWAVRVEEWHRGRFGQLFTPTGVNLDTMLGRGDVTATLRATLADNVSLVRSLDDQLRNGISGAVFRGLANRTPSTDVAREIRKVTGVGQRRAELIAADQLQKLTGRLDQERQEQVGIDEFEWQHSHKKFPRPEHVARNGLRFKWNSDVARNDPPGRAIRCGCRARAVVDLDDKTTPAKPAAKRAQRQTNATRDAAGRKFVLANGRKEGVEFLTAYDAGSGAQLGTNRGTRSACALTPEMNAAIASRSGKVVFHHNHPSSSSLSAPDLHLLLDNPGLKGIWAHGHNGSAFYAERGERGVLKATLRKTQEAVHAKMQALVSAGVVDIPSAILLDNHAAWLVLHARKQLNYRHELVGDSKAAAEKYAQFLALIVESLT